MTSGVPEPQAKDDVLQNIQSARAELEASIAGLSQEQLTGPVTVGGWSIKDHLAHIAEWQRRGLAVIEGEPPYVGLGIDKETFEQLRNVDEINEVLFQRHKDRPLGEVMEDFHETHRRVESMIEGMTDDDLQRSLDEDISPRYRRVVDIANFNFARHDRAHIEDIRALANQ
jgi:hypothetical protein